MALGSLENPVYKRNTVLCRGPGTKCEHNLSLTVLNIHLVLGVEFMARQTESQLTKQKKDQDQ